MERLFSTPTRNLIFHAILWSDLPPRRVDCLALLWAYMRGLFSQRLSDTLRNSGTKPKVDNFAVANLRSYPLRCTAASWDISIKCLSQEHNSVLYTVLALN